MDQIDELSNKADALIKWFSTTGVDYSIKLLGAIAVLIIGLWIIKFLSKRVYTIMDKTDITPALKSFTKSILSVTLKIILFISVLGMIGIKMTSIIAMMGAATLAIGMAFNGTLSNLAGGVMILGPWVLATWMDESYRQYQGYLVLMFLHFPITLGREAIWVVFPAYNKMEYVGISNLICGIINIALSIGFVFMGFSMTGVFLEPDFLLNASIC